MSRASALEDANSMPSIVLSSLQSIHRLTSRKHKLVRDKCEEFIALIQEEDRKFINPQSHSESDSGTGSSDSEPLVDTDADKYFLPFKIACECDSTKVIAASLAAIADLLECGYLDGSSIADPTLYPSTATSTNTDSKSGASTKGETRRLISVIVDTFHQCASIRDRDVQLQTLKCILTAMNSSSCQIHGQSIVHTVLACWQIFESAVDEIIRSTAKANLTQLFNYSYQRMESFAIQLKALEQSHSINPRHRDEEKVGSDGKDSDGVSINTTGSIDREKDEERVENNDINTTSSSIITTTTTTTTSETSPTSATTTTNTTTPISITGSGDRPAPGKRGYCIVCAKPANHYCLQSNDPVCGMECKLMNLQRRDKKNSHLANDVYQKIRTKFIILHDDAFRILKALIRISRRAPPHASPSPSQLQTNIDSKVLALELLLSIMRAPGHTFTHSQQFITLIKNDLFINILSNHDVENEQLFSLSSLVFVALVKHFRYHLQAQVGLLVESIYLPYISNYNSSYEHKMTSLLVLKQLCSDEQIILEIFLNYDCQERSQANTFEKMISTLEKIVNGQTMEQNHSLLSENEEAKLKLVALDAMIDTMKSLVKFQEKQEREWNDSEASAQSHSHSLTSLSASSPSPSPTVADEDSRSSPHARSATYVSAASSQSSQSSSSLDYQKVRTKKQAFQNGIMKFNNDSPSKGLQYLFDHSLLPNTPEAIAEFFHRNNKQLNKTNIGDYLGDEKPFHREVLKHFIDTMDFAGMDFDNGIRHMCQSFKLPGEGQKIDRIMERYSSTYTTQNPGKLPNADVAYVIGYSIIMLNTDLYNKSIAKHMSKQDYIKMHSKIDNGKDIDATILTEMFDRIAANEIKMTDNSQEARTRSHLQELSLINPGTRMSMFIRDSQQMIDKAQNALKNINLGNTAQYSKSHFNWSEDPNTAAQAGTNTDANNGSSSGGGSKGELPWIVAGSEHAGLIQPMFEVLWYPVLATLSVLLEMNGNDLTDSVADTRSDSGSGDSQSSQIISLCFEGYRLAIRISNACNLDVSRQAFVTSLKKFTLLGTTKEMKSKNVSAIKMLLSIVNSEGNFLKDTWSEVLMCISEVERLHLIANANKPDIPIFTGDSTIIPLQPAVVTQQRSKTGAVTPSNSGNVNKLVPSQPMKSRGVNTVEIDSVNAAKILIDPALIDRVFINSANLKGDAIIDFVRALRAVSEHELREQPPRNFSLQKIVEITYYNMGRIKLVWSRIWSILSEFFVEAGCHANLGVSLYAIDSLRQLAMKFLEKDELANFQFQKQFFRPFELIMAQNASVEARELIVQCMARMILARKRNIKSGWRGVFIVLAIAARSANPTLIQSAGDLLASMMESNFALITENAETLDEAVNCLISFGSQTVYSEISLQAIHYLTLCATHMAAVPQSQLQQPSSGSQANTPRKRSGSITTNTYSVLGIDGEMVETGQSSTPSTPSSAQALALSVGSISGNSMKVWFLLLTGLTRLTSNPRAEVRKLALDTLFSILNENGHVFTATTWRQIFHGVLLPIFDDVRYTEELELTITAADAHSHSHFAPAMRGRGGIQNDDISDSRPGSPHGHTRTANDSVDNLQSWLHTTCQSALSTTIQLFSRFYHTTNFLLPDLLHLVQSCIVAENETLARIGVDGLTLLMTASGKQWNVGSTWMVLESIMETVNKTLPVVLLSNRVRKLLDMQPKKSTHSTLRKLSTDAHTHAGNDSHSHSGCGNGKVEPREEKQLDSATISGQPQSVTDTRRASHSPSPSQTNSGRPVTLAFSAPLVYTRCKIQQLLLHSLYEVVQLCFPQRLSRPVSQSQPRRPSTAAASVSVSAPGGDSVNEESESDGGASGKPTNMPPPLTVTDTQSGIITAPVVVTGLPSGIHARSDSSSVIASPPNETASRRREDARVFHTFLPAHLLYALSIFSQSLSFAHEFNADVSLRKNLYYAGFIIERSGRLPQLFDLEALATRYVFLIMHRIWAEGGLDAIEAQSLTNTSAHSDIASVSENDSEKEEILAGHEIDHIDAKQANEIIEKASNTAMHTEAQTSSDSRSGSSSDLLDYDLTVFICYHRLSALTSRLLTDYLMRTQSGQKVSLEYIDEVIALIVDSYAMLPALLFSEDIEVLVPLFGELVEHGSAQVKQAVGRWIANCGVRMCRLARRQVKLDWQGSRVEDARMRVVLDGSVSDTSAS